MSFVDNYEKNKINSLANKRPDLLQIWNYEKNKENPFEVTCGSAKKFWWKCNICEDTYPMSVNKKTSNRGCSICSGYYTTEKNSFGGLYSHHLIDWDYDKNIEISPYDLSRRSGKKVWWKCSNCSSEYQMSPDKKSESIIPPNSCKMCNSKVSFGEKVVNDILVSSNIIFEREKKFDWSNNKRFDFYIESLKTIIEVNGEQHYHETFSRMNGRTLKEEKVNDLNKEILAKNNGIINYLIVDSRIKEIDEILNQLIEYGNYIEGFNINYNKKESKIFNLDILKSQSWNLWNQGYTMSDIASLLNIGRSTARRYVKLGDSLGKCKYESNRKKSLLKNNEV